MSENRKTLRDSANSFKTASDRCFERRQSPTGQIEFLVIPAVVNLAFSAELFLKFLLNPSRRWHSLIDLYNQLAEPMKLEIISSTSFQKAAFEELLTKHSKVFEEWRYLHESERKDVNIDFMTQLVASLNEISNKVTL